MRISFVVAMSRNAVIGTDTGLPWHLPQDLRRFRQLTLGKPVIVGRKTIELIGRPLPDRTNIVLTRGPHYRREGVLVVHSTEEARAVAEREAARRGVDEVMVIGGNEVYRLFFPVVDRVHLTIVHGDFDGTVRFPVELLDPADFTVKERAEFAADAKNPHRHDYLVLERRTDPVQPPAEVLQSLLSVA